MKIILSFLLCLYVAAVDSVKPGCPEAIDVKPCVCTNSPFTYLQCRHLDDTEVLRKVFDNSSKYAFREVHIEYSAFAFLPHDIFEQVPVTELHLTNVTLSRLFDKVPTHLEKLDILHIEHVKLIRGFLWWMMEPLKQLRILNIYYNNIKIVGTEFNKYVTKNLEQITFYDTATKILKPGAFKDFVNLEKVEFDRCLLTNLSRDIFPTPFNVKFMYLNNNQIKTLPDDMFINMPNLSTVGLRGNLLSVLPPSAFPTDRKLTYLRLDGNPIICDCRLAWLIRDKPQVLTGTCNLPSKYRGISLEEVDFSSFKC